jgi:hypothetical protein
MMMKRFEMRVLLAVCFAIAMTAIACAQGQAEAMMGAGVVSCAEYAKADRIDPNYAEDFFLSWAAGYMSGINSLNKDAFFDLSAITSDEMKRYLRQYCNEHPFANYGDGVRDLLNTLPVHQRDKK